LKEFKHLSYASSLCGRCTEVCPAKINLHELLLYNRNDAVKNYYYSSIDKITMFGWKKIMLNRWMMDFGNANMKNKILNKVFTKAWGSRRALPVVKQKNFHQLWMEKIGAKH